MSFEMIRKRAVAMLATLAVTTLGLAPGAQAQQSEMTFFITSAGPGDGANLGGLEGADAHCAKLAKAAGSSLTNWRAYLSKAPKIDRSGGRPKGMGVELHSPPALYVRYTDTLRKRLVAEEKEPVPAG